MAALVFYIYDKNDSKICAYSVALNDKNRLRAFEDNMLVVGPEYTLGHIGGAYMLQS